jgi:hypothetical protein
VLSTILLLLSINVLFSARPRSQLGKLVHQSDVSLILSCMSHLLVLSLLNSLTKDVLLLNTTFAIEQLALWFKNRTGVSACSSLSI